MRIDEQHAGWATHAAMLMVWGEWDRAADAWYSAWRACQHVFASHPADYFAARGYLLWGELCHIKALYAWRARA